MMGSCSLVRWSLVPVGENRQLRAGEDSWQAKTRVRLSPTIAQHRKAVEHSTTPWVKCQNLFLSNEVFVRACESASCQREKIRDTLSNGGVVFLLASSLGYSLCEKVLAAAEAVPASENNANVTFIVACIAEGLALTGAVVGGVLARQRKEELERINAQLRQINVNLRRQSRLESYAPNLTYAPVGSGRLADNEVRSDPTREELMKHLKAGKRWLREQQPVSAYKEFELALPLAKKLKDTVEEKKAVRGLGASCQRQGKYREAIKYHTMVLNISHMTREHSGDTEAYGAIADCYTELGDLETAAKFYDQYIERLEQDD